MRIPRVIGKNGNQYIFVKEYPNFIMYKDMITGTKECFSRHDLGLLKEVAERTKKVNPEISLYGNKKRRNR